MGRKTIAGILLILAFLLLAGCTGGAQTPSPSVQQGTSVQTGHAADQTQKNLVVKDAELKKIYEAALATPLPDTPSYKIRSAFDEKKISKEEYIVLSLQALFEPESLPQQYAGADAGRSDAYSELMLAVENWDSLSTASKEKIHDWVFLSEEETAAEQEATGESAVSQQIQATIEPTVEATVEPTVEATEEPQVETPSEEPTVEATEEPYVEEAGAHVLYFAGPALKLYSLEAIPGKAVVKGFLPSGHSQADKTALDAKMQLVKQAIVDSWDKFKNLLGLEPNQIVYIYVSKMPKSLFGQMDITTEASDPVKRCRGKVNIDLSNANYAKAGTAHELFHCFQFYIPLVNWVNSDESWIIEATATWSEHYVYPTYNTEHEYLPDFYKTRDKPLVSSQPKLKKYGDYNFFLYLQESSGVANVAKVLLASKNGVKASLKQLPDFENQFADFAFWNWNKEPFDYYTDTPKYPETSVSGPAVILNQLTDASKSTAAVSIDAGAATYRVYDVMVGQSVKKLEFKFPDSDDNIHQRHALLKIDGEWIDEQWTGLTTRRFCLDRTGEKVEAVVLIYSNADLNAPFFNQYDVDTTGECPAEITGTTVMETSVTAPLEGGEFKVSSRYVSHDVLQYDEAENAYKLKSRSVTCKTTTKAQGAGMDSYLGAPYLASLAAQGDCSGAATFNYNNLAEATEKIRFNRADNTLSVDLDPAISNGRWIRCSTFQKMGFGDVALIIKQIEYSGTCGSLGPPSLVDWDNLNMLTDLQANRLHKEESQTMPVEGGTTSMKITIDYSLTEKP